MINNDRIRNMIDKNALQNSIEWVKGSSKGVMGTPLDHLTIEAIQIVEAHEGFLRCNFIVPFHLLVNNQSISILFFINFFNRLICVRFMSISFENCRIMMEIGILEQ